MLSITATQQPTSNQKFEEKCCLKSWGKLFIKVLMCMYSFPILCFISVLLVLPYGWNFILPGNPSSCMCMCIYYVLYNITIKNLLFHIELAVIICVKYITLLELLWIHCIGSMCTDQLSRMNYIIEMDLKHVVSYALQSNLFLLKKIQHGSILMISWWNSRSTFSVSFHILSSVPPHLYWVLIHCSLVS